MLYHQTPQQNHDDRVSVLKKAQNKYIWEGVEFPVSLQDTATFEENKKESVFVYGVNDNISIDKLRNGHAANRLANHGKRTNTLYLALKHSIPRR